MSDLQREKFEAWYRKDVINVNRKPEVDLIKGLAFRAWQAAIELVVVELPEPHQDEWKELNLSVDEVKKALDDAGVKYVLPETFVRY